MRTRIHLSVALMLLCMMLQAQDFARLSERSITGTARFIGMSGAMTAIGGDPSAVLANPAGLGLYRRSEVMVTGDVMLDRTRHAGANLPGERNIYMLPQASFVLSFPTYSAIEKGVLYNNVMVSYNRVHSFGREIIANGTHDVSLGSLLQTADVNWDIPFCNEKYFETNSLNLRETGYVNEYGVDWGMNISNQWYVGAGLHIQSYILSSDANYQEIFYIQNAEGRYYYNTNATTLLLTGAGCNFSVGAIYRPLSWLRLGLSLQTPSLGRLNTYTTGSLTSQTDTLATSYAPECQDYTYRFHSPLHLSTSAAFQIGAYGMASIQYDYTHQTNQYNLHSFRVGLEVIPILGLYINAGYAYESSFDKRPFIVPMDNTFDRQDTYYEQPRWTQYASFAIGYRGYHMMFQAAYQFRWQGLNLYAHENAIPYDIHTQTHRIVFTLGWHRY